MPRLIALGCMVLGLTLAMPAHADSGYELWLRYRPLSGARRTAVASHARAIVRGAPSPTLDAADEELSRAMRGMLGTALQDARAATIDGALVIGTPRSLPLIKALGLPLGTLGRDGYLIRSMRIGGHAVTVIAGNDDVGVLYGSFAWLRIVQTGASLDHLAIASSPKLKLRVLDHWDNIDGTVGRGYAGKSIWDWWTLPAWGKQRYTDYARADASIGINGAVLNNVNASAQMLTHRYLVKVAKLAAMFRPYGVKVYLSAKFSAPVEIGGLKTADPLNPAVRAWWNGKADEIYALIPDFGGFVVKANSEGQPGPQDYGRSHADGANMMAAALAPHGGIVMWRAFVYAHGNAVGDRTAQAYDQFKPLDGKFADNVLVQVKNGPIDFQPREPFSPLFDAMPQTPLMMEFQITKEYLGFATHLVYLGALFQETLEADTGGGKTVADVIEDRAHPDRLTGMAGVANTGTDLDWTGGVFNQANWYAFGRLAWDPQADARAIARDWAAMTFSTDPAFIEPVADMMMTSREAVVNYMTPLGLAHQMVPAAHYGPAPWVDDRAHLSSSSVYYSGVSHDGIGFDRTASGSDQIVQYAPSARAPFADPAAAGGRYLLWFHHEPWTFRVASGETLWASLVGHYDLGVAQVAGMQRTWARLRGYVDPQRFGQVTSFLAVQHAEAAWWRDASVAYFQSVSGLPLPAGVAAPAHDLRYYEAVHVPDVPGQD